MNELTDLTATDEPVDSASFFIRGKVIEGHDSMQRSRDLGVTFATPKLLLDELVQPPGAPPRSSIANFAPR